MWPLQRTQGFSHIWPSDQVLDPTYPFFELVWDFIMINILTKFHDNRTENVASRAYTSQEVDDAEQTTDKRHITVTIAYYKHFMLRWDKNSFG